MMAAEFWVSHIIRYGATLNHLQGGGFASFFKNGPTIIFPSHHSGYRS